MRYLAAFLAAIIAAPVAFADETYTKNVAIVVYESVEVLDFAGPGEVFQAAASFGRWGNRPAFRVYTVAPSKDAILSQRFVRVQPEFSIDDAPKPDIIVIPGGDSSQLTENPKFMTWAKKSIGEAELTLSVCTGAFVLSRLGYLDGLDVTTFYNAIPSLRRETPKARVHDGRRFIDNGKYVTTAGVSAGIDGSLHVVARLLGRVVADQTAQYMEYRWTPETYLTSSYEILNPRLDARGKSIQNADVLMRGRKWDEAVAAYRTILAQYPDDIEAKFSLARALYANKSFDEAIAQFNQVAAMESPFRARAFYNAACAYSIRGDKDRAMEMIEKAIAAGFRDKGSFNRDEDLSAVRSDPRFQKLVAAL
jgi:transcriptional regulator GlxA family with amidase domain